MYIFLPLLELRNIEHGADKPYPYRMRFPYDGNKPVTYAITYFLTSLAGFGVVTNLFSEDSLFAFFTTHTCGRLQLLNENISNIMKVGQERALNKYPKLVEKDQIYFREAAIQREYKLELIKLIRDHNTVIG